MDVGVPHVSFSDSWESLQLPCNPESDKKKKIDEWMDLGFPSQKQVMCKITIVNNIRSSELITPAGLGLS